MDTTKFNLNKNLNIKDMGLSGTKYLGFALLPILLWLYFIICWVVNLVKLVSCDFEGPWKEEIIHAIGLMGPAAGITAWM